jgi:hypothetical protein
MPPFPAVIPTITASGLSVTSIHLFNISTYSHFTAETSSSDEQSISSGVLANGSGTATGIPSQSAFLFPVFIHSIFQSSPIDTETIMGGDTTIGHVRTAFQHSLLAATKAAQRAEGRLEGEESPPRTPPPAPPVGNNEIHLSNHLPVTMGGGSRRISHSVHHQAMGEYFF